MRKAQTSFSVKKTETCISKVPYLNPGSFGLPYLQHWVFWLGVFWNLGVLTVGNLNLSNLGLDILVLGILGWSQQGIPNYYQDHLDLPVDLITPDVCFFLNNMFIFHPHQNCIFVYFSHLQQYVFTKNNFAEKKSDDEMTMMTSLLFTEWPLSELLLLFGSEKRKDVCLDALSPTLVYRLIPPMCLFQFSLSSHKTRLSSYK